LHRVSGDGLVVYYQAQTGLIHHQHQPALIREELCAYYYRGRLHNESGPAVIYKSGRQEWWWHGYLHRHHGDLPTVVDCQSQFWHRWGKLHRESGPAVVRGEGSEEFWLDGRFQHF
jgi:hypothetical protein